LNNHSFAKKIKNMKKTCTLFLLVLSSIAFAQIPTGYYDTATGTGYTLKTQLKTIISVENIVSGPVGYDNLYTTYQTSDIDNFYEKDGTILDMYSEKPAASDPYNFSKETTQRCGTYTKEGDCYNREHIIPQSIFNQLSPMRNDAHFIAPTDGKVNGYRSNFPHGMVGTLDVPSPTSNITNPTANGSKLGNGLNSGYATGYTGIVFEPIDEFKGDIARMYFYFATKYQDQLTTWGKPYPMFDGSANKVFTTTFLNILLAWNTLDPVSDREVARNNAIYITQGNRNPYIDHPEYVNLVWNVVPDTENPTAPTNLTVTGATSSTVSLSWTAATDNTGIANYSIYVDGVLKDNTTGLTKTITGLKPSTNYSFYVITKDFDGNSSPASTSVSETTTEVVVGGNSNELFFSEYVEGTSLNKALEIVNLTGAPVDLSIYSLKKQSNGAGPWLTSNPLSGTLANGSVYVAVDSGIATTCYALASANVSYNGTTTSSPTSFNGNDAVGLFKNDVLIDIIGAFNGGTADFAKDQTLRRKSTVTGPNTTFNKALEWDILPVNTCDDIGTYSVVTLSNVDFNSDAIKIFSNSSNGNFTVNFTNSNALYSLQIYSIIGQKVFEKEKINVSTTTINQIKTGIYVVKINQDSKFYTKKIIVK
jgi:endonuclease I